MCCLTKEEGEYLMLRQKQLSRAVQAALYGAAAVVTIASTPALAQSADDESSSGVLEEIIVTGSRITVDPNLVTSSPVTTVNAGELTHRGVTRVEDLVNDLPQIVPEFTATESNGATGTATLDLRGLGSERTLVLINGHRMGLGDPFELAPDINQIPSVLVERIELLTGGASSVYGADAVAGVVNFITKRDFEGFQLDWNFAGYQSNAKNKKVRQAVANSGFEQGPKSPRDGNTTDINVLLGANTADGNGNVTAYLGYRDINGILHGDRDFSACSLSSDDGETCAGSATLPTGFFSPFDGVNYFTVAGDEFVPWDYTYYNYGPLNHFQRPDERITAGAFGHYQISEAFEGYAELQFMDDRSLAQIAPSGNFFETDTINCSNFFLSDQQSGVLGCTDPSDVVPWYIGRRNVEGGPRFDDLRHTNIRGLVGVRGDIGENWSYDISGNFSRNRFSQVYNNDVSITRLVRALDVVDDGNGNAVCQSVVDGSDPTCVPWNVFQTGGVTPEAIAYLDLPLFSKGDLEQDQIVAYVTGDLTDSGVVIPSATDGLQVVFGVESREDNMDFNPDQGFRSGDGSGQGGAVAAVTGRVQVDEIFTELKVPLVQDKSGFQSLALDLRYRYSDYNTGDQTDTWNVGVEWRPVDSVMIRGGVSQAVRAANINELFEPQTQGLWSGTDPCAGATPVLTEAQCANTGVTAAQYLNVPSSPAGQYNATFGGSEMLIPETSDSTTIGVVFTPSGALEGLTVSLDYWNIDVQDAIAAGLGEEFTITQCGLTGDSTFCDLISRGPNGNLWVGDANVISTNLNIGFFDVAGFDINATYGFDVGRFGTLDLALRGTLLDKWDQQPLPGAAVEDCKGVWGGSCQRPRPEWKHTFNAVWSTNFDTDIAMTWRRISKVDEFVQDRYTAPAQDYIDLSGTYSTEWFGAATTLNAGISNVFDNAPPVNGLLNNIDLSNGNTVPGTWDALGRYYFVGFSLAY